MSPAQQRRWDQAQHAARSAVLVSWPQAIANARALDDKQLAEAISAGGGCTSFSCVQHGALNHERRARAERVA